mgnify:CR=1 FL=1
MKKTLVLFVLAAGLLASASLPGLAQGAGRARDILPAEGLVASSVVGIRDQAALNAHYYLADEAVLGLGRKTDAVLARYRAKAGEALLLVVAYPSPGEAKQVYERFGRDFFSEAFDPSSARVVEMIETGDWAGAVRKGSFLIIVLEAPDRTGCDSLLRRVEEKVPAPNAK